MCTRGITVPSTHKFTLARKSRTCQLASAISPRYACCCQHHSSAYRPFSSCEQRHSLKLKLFVVRHLGAQVTIGLYGQNKALGYYCMFTVSDYGFGFIFLQWAFHGKNIKVLRDPKQA